MDRITLKNYRCFRDEQSARLAPLTLLVGDNSTGKTSFLALIRILCDVAAGAWTPDFKEEPYDLGSFDEIVHHRGYKKDREDTFEAGLDITIHYREGDSQDYEKITQRHRLTFGKSGTTPSLINRRINIGNSWFEERLEERDIYRVRMGTPNGTWQVKEDFAVPHEASRQLLRLYQIIRRALTETDSGSSEHHLLKPTHGSQEISQHDVSVLEAANGRAFWPVVMRPFASAPVRSKPRRTYDPARFIRDPEGEYAPMYLANLFFDNKEGWLTYLKDRLERFGRTSGLFDEISIRQLGKHQSEPFQIQVRKFGKRLKGPRRNLIDVGYGVSQVLPLAIELLRPDAPDIFLLQQPEVHLHPSAQAALGSLFCEVASPRKYLVVETHSDHLLDRVRMDVRDGVSDLKPQDVSILFFERNELDVRIHSLRIDEEGNIRDAPNGYRQFFMEETRRSLDL